jgi:hypothetical protein
MENEDLKLLATELGKHFLAELSFLKGLCSLDLNERARNTKIVIASACSTGTAIHELSKKPEYFYSETIMLSRSFIEKMTNFCYLQVCDESEYERFLLHPLYRAFHNTDRKRAVGANSIGLNFSGRAEMGKDVNVQKALEAFSDSNPKLNWSNLGIDKKVALLAERSKISIEFFLMNTLTLYSDASEALHGSLYGCALPTRAYNPGENYRDVSTVEKNLLKNIALLYVQMGSLIHETLKMFSSTEDVKKLIQGSEKNHKYAIQVMKVIFPGKKEDPKGIPRSFETVD